MLNVIKNTRSASTLIPVDQAIEIARKRCTKVHASIGTTPSHIISYTKKPTVRTGRPANWQYMTPAEATRLLEEQVRIAGRCRDNLKWKQPLGTLAEDDGSVAVGASFCSAKRRFDEFSKKDGERFSRQPYFKGVERNRRRLAADIWH